MNLYFWHLESEGGVSVRREDFLGRADSPRVKRELLQRMAGYDRRMEETLAGRVAKLERSLGRAERPSVPAVVVVEDSRGSRSADSLEALFVGARGN